MKAINQDGKQYVTFSPVDESLLSVGVRIWGEVYGHPRFRDGEMVTTSPIQRIFNGGFETMNTVYLLKDGKTYNE